jgi:diguanylate cyclase (GGDEF)-like protein
MPAAMGARAKLLWSRLFDVGEAETPFGQALLRERYRALQRQVPLLYTIALINFLGLTFASGVANFTLSHPANLLIPLVLLRLIYWVRRRGQELAPAEIRIELKRTMVLAGLLSLGFGLSAISLYGESPGYQQDLIILFAALAAIGCAYGLSSFPAAARLPLFLFALPFAARLAASANPGHAGVGISLALIVLLIHRLVGLNNDGFVRLVRSRSEVESERERARRAERAALREKARVRQVADTDPLTGLANRRALLARLKSQLRARKSDSFALALLDLDEFKPINDTFGHAAGDAVLVEVATRLRHEAGAGAIAARIGGDEFALILPCAEEADLVGIGERICRALGKPYRLGAREFRVSTCCGLVVLRPGQCDAAVALGRADAALYNAKQSGRGAASLFTPAIEKANQRRIAIERKLMDSGICDAISLSYQPIFDLSTGALRAFEALARWTDPELGLVAPSEFIPVAEHINMIEGISDALLARSAAEAANWPAAVRLSFNLSAVHLCAPQSAERLLAIVAGEGLDPARLQIEVTETALLADFSAARRNLGRLRRAGARVLLDDFGSGFASISYLREMMFDAIQIDGSLVRGVPDSPPAVRLLKGVIDLCDSLGVPCVAEHIETKAQLALLRALGCRDGQGFILSRPIGAEEARALSAAKVVPFGPRGVLRGTRAA